MALITFIVRGMIMMIKSKERNLLREKISDIQHEIWSSWMTHLFKVSIHNNDGSYTIPLDKVKRWKRQLSTSYDELTESEKDSDRKQADKILDILNNK